MSKSQDEILMSVDRPDDTTEGVPHGVEVEEHELEKYTTKETATSCRVCDQEVGDERASVQTQMRPRIAFGHVYQHQIHPVFFQRGI